MAYYEYKKHSPVKQTPSNFGHLGYSNRDSASPFKSI